MDSYTTASAQDWLRVLAPRYRRSVDGQQLTYRGSSLCYNAILNHSQMLRTQPICVLVDDDRLLDTKLLMQLTLLRGCVANVVKAWGELIKGTERVPMNPNSPNDVALLRAFDTLFAMENEATTVYKGRAIFLRLTAEDNSCHCAGCEPDIRTILTPIAGAGVPDILCPRYTRSKDGLVINYRDRALVYRDVREHARQLRCHQQNDDVDEELAWVVENRLTVLLHMLLKVWEMLINSSADRLGARYPDESAFCSSMLDFNLLCGLDEIHALETAMVVKYGRHALPHVLTPRRLFDSPKVETMSIELQDDLRQRAVQFHSDNDLVGFMHVFSDLDFSAPELMD